MPLASFGQLRMVTKGLHYRSLRYGILVDFLGKCWPNWRGVIERQDPVRRSAKQLWPYHSATPPFRKDESGIQRKVCHLSSSVPSMGIISIVVVEIFASENGTLFGFVWEPMRRFPPPKSNRRLRRPSWALSAKCGFGSEKGKPPM
jgi:hypothetical protein